MDVHREIGPGFLEVIYQRALKYELELIGMSAEAEVDYAVEYKDLVVGRHRVDLIVEQTVVLELKASSAINQAHIAQTLSYLKATRPRTRVDPQLRNSQPSMETVSSDPTNRGTNPNINLFLPLLPHLRNQRNPP